MSRRPWESPGAWMKSAAILAATWLVVYLFTHSVSAATTIVAIFLIAGLAGVLYT